ncbi:MAG: glycosyltransferase family 4 protein [Anaerolineae bacterium]|nr:glycosyltransferase family 4 protein [Anaerolineae bacterium]
MSKPWHIAHFTNTYLPVINGVVRSVSTFRQALTDLGHNVFVFAQHASDYEDAEPFIFRYPAIDLPIAHNYPLTIPISPFVDRLLPALKPNVIHSHHPVMLGRTAASKAQELGLPLVFTFHTRYREYSHYLSLKQDWVKNAIDRWVGEYLQNCQHIVVPSESIRQMLFDAYGVKDRVTVIPTGINLAPFQTAKGSVIRRKRGWGRDKVLISVGRLAKEKNWETLLAAVAQVMKTHADVRLVIIGQGDEEKSLEKLTQKMGIARRVEFSGPIPFDEIPCYLKAADLFCFASVTETQGLVTMEALAAGLPVVAVDASGTRDVIEHDEEGLLTDNNCDALARAIEQVLNNPVLRQRFKEAAKRKVKYFDALYQARRLMDVYQQAVEDKKAKQTVHVDKRKKIFKFIIDEEQWQKLLGGVREKVLLKG